MLNIISLIPRWGYTDGGVNAFNVDFCSAIGKFSNKKHSYIFCISLQDTDFSTAEIAAANNVKLITLNSRKNFNEISLLINRKIKDLKLSGQLILVGHDVFSGQIANDLSAEFPGSKSVVFHHMDYRSYYAIKGKPDPQMLRDKTDEQDSILESADLVIGVGPKLENSARNKTSKTVKGLIPGMQIIENWPNESNVLHCLVFGRYDHRTDNLKQMKLALNGFAKYIIQDNTEAGYDASFEVVGIDDLNQFEEFKKLGLKKDSRYVNVIATPYSTDRNALYSKISKATMCLMLSVHEGFGLVGFESIAAGTPLILSKNTGLYLFLQAKIDGDFREYGIITIDVRGSNGNSIDDTDVQETNQAIKEIWTNIKEFRIGIRKLKQKLLADFRWENTASNFFKLLDVEIIPKLNLAEKPQKVVTENETTQIRYENVIATLFDDLLGREADIAKIEETFNNLSSSNKLVIWGIGGVGKTSIALQCARLVKAGNSYKRKFNSIIWLPIRTTIITLDSIQSEYSYITIDDIYAKIASVFKIQDLTKQSSYEQETTIIERLKTEKTLLIFDNFEVVKDHKILNFIHSLAQETFIIITSRDKIDSISKHIPLESLDESTSVKLINKYASLRNIIITQEQVLDVYKITGGLPLAIEWCMVHLSDVDNLDKSINLLPKEVNDLLKFCFEENVKKLKNQGFFDVLIAASLFPGGATSDQLEFVSNMTSENVSFESAIRQIKRMSLIDYSNNRYDILPLTKRLIITELSNFQSYYEACKLRVHNVVNKFLVDHTTLLLEKGLELNIWDSDSDNIIETIDSYSEKNQQEQLVESAINLYPYIFVYGRWSWYLNLCQNRIDLFKSNEIDSQKILLRAISIAEHAGNIELSDYLYKKLNKGALNDLNFSYEEINLLHFVESIRAVNRDTENAMDVLDRSLRYEVENEKHWTAVGFMGWQAILACKRKNYVKSLAIAEAAIQISIKHDLSRSLTFLYPIYLRSFNLLDLDPKELKYEISVMEKLTEVYSEIHNKGHFLHELGIFYKKTDVSAAKASFQNAEKLYHTIGLSSEAKKSRNEFKKL
ncbi:NB-ARC domain-containing protein [Pedobacter sp. D749]|uniref:NB-ARC domain-containing protein n=1 Tax=Pedobacter sp. D749 TaxID=2856523 RepID=UPI001C591861|nr:NB-ARC domain-containing protein [Pedobacter sp. D749]QXU42800.1 glycosyltransferase [Pedobacter sp. D749]